jgi:hypothetical protein
VVQGLAGVDFLTISPKLLQDLSDDKSELKQLLSVDAGMHMHMHMRRGGRRGRHEWLTLTVTFRSAKAEHSQDHS